MTLLARASRGDRAWGLALVLAAVFFAVHLPFLASTLEDVDSINFALGVRDFDPGAHRPHPPGYPIFMALGKTARLVLDEPAALAIWAALFGALAVGPLLRFFQALDAADRPAGDASDGWWSPALLATVVTVTAPLYWMTAVRPMSDSVGLAFALTAQALLATAFVRQTRDVPDARGAYDAHVAARSGRLILMGAFVAAVSVGTRSQALWLTAPLLVFVVLSRAGRGAAGAMLGGAVWFVAGTLVWLVPLVIAAGGPSAYLAAFATQAGEDWHWIDLLITRPSVRSLAMGLLHTFVTHWAALGWFVVVAAASGAGVVLLRGRRALLVLLVAFLPYGVFHLLFQELVTTRYALPLLIPVAYLAVRGVWVFGRVAATLLVSACVVGALVQVVPVTMAYAGYGSPVSHAIADIRAETLRTGPVSLARRHTYARALQADLDDARVNVLVPGPGQVLGGDPPPSNVVGPGAREDWFTWRDLPQLVVARDGDPIWLLDTPQHLLVSLIDPAALVVRRAYRWPFDAPTYLGGVRPSDVDWIEIRRPGWVVGEGWHLTPDTAGRAVAVGKGLGAGPIDARVRARDREAHVLIGGRHLGGAGTPDLRFSARVDDHVIDTWVVKAGDPFFLRVTLLPAGTLTAAGSPWRRLRIEAVDTATGAASPQAAVEQFDLRDADGLLMGYGRGWHEHEFNPASGVRWRWTSASAEIRIAGPVQDMDVTVRGESPLRSYSGPSTVTLKAGDRVLATLTAADDINWTVRVPRDAWASAAGVLTLTTDQTFTPADRAENADRRVLGLRVYEVTVTPASTPGTAGNSRTAGE